MKPAEMWTYALLLLITAAFAHHSWTDEDTQTKTEVLVFDPGSAGLDRIEWWGARNAATLEVQGKSEEQEVWLSAGKRPRLAAASPAPAQGDDDDSGSGKEQSKEPAAPVYGEPELVSFPGSKAARDLVARYAPLKALRQFDNLSSEQLEAMGLDAPEERLTVAAGGRTLVLEVGAKAYGSSDTYVRKEGASTVWLLSSKALGPLRSASTSLRDRNIFGFEATEASTAVLTSPNAEPLALHHHGRHDKENAHWSRDEAAEDRDSLVDGFIKKVFQLKANSYLKEADVPTDDSLEALFRVDFTAEDGDSVGSTEMARAVDSAKSRNGEVAYTWYARSPRTRQQWVKVSRSVGQELTDGLSSLR